MKQSITYSNDDRWTILPGSFQVEKRGELRWNREIDIRKSKQVANFLICIHSSPIFLVQLARLNEVEPSDEF